ncbi:MAG: ABC transporter substrate-binding protein [Actinobacteria bacterium]|nr:MAG: ABC transporter substrate-binding protein [Actinomycetota bacterium]
MLTITVGCASSTAATGNTVTFYIFNEPGGSFVRAADTCTQAAQGRYRIQLALLPSGADGQRQQLVRRLAAHDASIDIMGMDVVWAPEFAEAGWIKPVPDNIKAQVTSDGTLPASLKTATWKKTLYALPYNTNTQLLWYRKDLVPTPPATWDQMISEAVALRQQGKPGLIEVQGAQYEGLTVWFNSLVASAGGRTLDDDGNVAVDDTSRVAADIMHRLATSPAADPSLSNTMEDQARLAFESGKAAFELNYPFVYPSAQQDNPAVAKVMAWAPWPSVNPNTPSHVTIGGIDLGVSAYSRHPDLAFQAAACLRDADNQKYAAIKGGLPPTIESLYGDPELRRSYPFAEAILQSLREASTRPLTPAYTNVSLEVQSLLSPPSHIDPPTVPPQLRIRLRDAIASRGLVP